MVIKNPFMSGTKLYNLYQELVDDDVSYVFLGKFNYPILNEVLVELRKEFEKDEEDLNSSRKAYRVVVECLENIYRHTKDEHGAISAVFVLKRTSKGYSIHIGNKVNTVEKDSLIKSIENLSSKSPSELKALYKSTMKAPDKGFGGAGVGLIEIAIRSNGDFSYTFDELGDDLWFFSFDIGINK